MKKMIFASAIGILLSFAVVAQTPTPTPRTAKPSSTPSDSTPGGGTGAEGKVGFVNGARFSVDILELKAKLDALNSEFEPKQKEVKAAEEELNNLKNKIQAQGGAVSPQVRNQWVEDAVEKEKVLKRKGEDYTALFQKRFAEVSEPIYGKIQKFMAIYCPRNGIAVLFEGGTAYQSGGLMWSTQESDITDDFIKEYNKANPVVASTSGGAKKN